MPNRRILVVDDEENIGRSLRMILEREGYQVNALKSAAELRAFPERARIDLFLLDVRLPDASGIDLLRELQSADTPAPVIMISGHATISDAVEATRAGAFDFLEKPLGRDRVMVAVKNALEQGSLKQENKRLKEAIGPGAKMIGSSPAFERAVTQASMAARSDARVLLIGESGTGKELLAAHIHAASPFAAGPFVKVNCAAIPGELIESELFGHEKGAFTGAMSRGIGRFEQAQGGTLFLDEIGDMPIEAQTRLLRVLQEGEFTAVGGRVPIRADVRIIAATHHELR
ncbi:MAG: sigma-54-dependent Fis family transcriptional regulator, partial [Acidobacteriota bacterium]|nr:sigma-54-dependent Fis family transcriptional regulator [Acidobacteriota bacterium]